MTHHHTKSIPILVDNSLNRAFAIKYAVFAGFGLSAVFFGLPSVSELWGGGLAFITGIMVFLSAAAAGVAAWYTERGIRWQKAGIYCGYGFIFSAGLYAVALMILTFQGDGRRASAAIISLALLVMPIWYIRYLIRRVRNR
jgi:hypothetical protein